MFSSILWTTTALIPSPGVFKWDPVVARAVSKAGRAVHGVPGTKRR